MVCFLRNSATLCFVDKVKKFGKFLKLLIFDIWDFGYDWWCHLLRNSCTSFKAVTLCISHPAISGSERRRQRSPSPVRSGARWYRPDRLCSVKWPCSASAGERQPPHSRRRADPVAGRHSAGRLDCEAAWPGRVLWVLCWRRWSSSSTICHPIFGRCSPVPVCRLAAVDVAVLELAVIW